MRERAVTAGAGLPTPRHGALAIRRRHSRPSRFAQCPSGDLVVLGLKIETVDNQTADVLGVASGWTAVVIGRPVVSFRRHAPRRRAHRWRG
jgi:hypothetical protein